MKKPLIINLFFFILYLFPVFAETKYFDANGNPISEYEYQQIEKQRNNIQKSIPENSIKKSEPVKKYESRKEREKRERQEAELEKIRIQKQEEERIKQQEEEALRIQKEEEERIKKQNEEKLRLQKQEEERLRIKLKREKEEDELKKKIEERTKEQEERLRLQKQEEDRLRLLKQEQENLLFRDVEARKLESHITIAVIVIISVFVLFFVIKLIRYQISPEGRAEIDKLLKEEAEEALRLKEEMERAEEATERHNTEDTELILMRDMNDSQKMVFLSEMNKFRLNRTTGFLLTGFLGGFGSHHFYMGNVSLGVTYLLFCWTFIPGIVALIELFSIMKKIDAYNVEKAKEIAAKVINTIN
jgi:TM2 domain-containing membrane protein YozV